MATPSAKYDYGKPSEEKRQVWARPPKGADVRWVRESVSNDPRVTAVDLRGVRLTDGTLAEIGKLRRLEVLDLRGKKTLTPEDFRDLGNLENLRELMLGGSSLTDAGLAELEQLDKVEILYLWRTRITDEGLFHLRGMKRLRVLFASDTRIRGPGVRYLAECPLRVLWLGRCPVDDAGVAEIARQTTIDNLDLYGTGITDDALPLLYGLERLRRIALRDTRVTKEGISELRRKFPMLTEIH